MNVSLIKQPPIIPSRFDKAIEKVNQNPRAILLSTSPNEKGFPTIGENNPSIKKP